MSRSLLKLAAVALVVLGLASPAEAIFRMRVENTATGKGVVISDNAAGDLSPLDNVLLVSVAIDNFVVSVSTGLRSPLLVMPGFYEGIDLNSVTVNASGPGALRIILVADDFDVAPDGPLTLNSDVGGVLSGSPGSTAAFTSWANPGNEVPDLGADRTTVGALGAVGDLPPAGSTAAPTLTFGNGAFSGTSSAGLTKSGPYSLFSQVVVTFTGPGSVSFDHQTATSPAPAGALLLAAGLPCLAAGYLRRRQAAPAA